MLDINFLFHLFVYICLTVEHFFITYLVIFLDSVFSFFNLRLGGKVTYYKIMTPNMQSEWQWNVLSPKILMSEGASQMLKFNQSDAGLHDSCSALLSNRT